jgi:hypothetical protein
MSSTLNMRLGPTILRLALYEPLSISRELQATETPELCKTKLLILSLTLEIYTVTRSRFVTFAACTLASSQSDTVLIKQAQWLFQSLHTKHVTV